MAIQANSLIKLSDVINKINNELRVAMQNRIVWYRSNLPKDFPADAGWTNRFETTKTLPEVNPGSSLAGTVMSFNKIYDVILRAFVIWSQVRKISYRYTYQHSDGGGTWYDDYTQTEIGRISESNANIANGMKNQITSKNKIIKTSTAARAVSIDNFITTLYNRWNQLISDNPVSWRYDACHASCHSSCHKSGGRR